MPTSEEYRDVVRGRPVGVRPSPLLESVPGEHPFVVAPLQTTPAGLLRLSPATDPAGVLLGVVVSPVREPGQAAGGTQAGTVELGRVPVLVTTRYEKP